MAPHYQFSPIGIYPGTATHLGALDGGSLCFMSIDRKYLVALLNKKLPLHLERLKKLPGLLSQSLEKPVSHITKVQKEPLCHS